MKRILLATIALCAEEKLVAERETAGKPSPE